MLIIDCHVHLNNYHEDNVTVQANLDRLLATMDENGIDKALILTSYMANEKRPRVDTVIDLVEPYKNLFVVEGVSLAGAAPFDLQAMEARLKKGLTVGIKLYPGYEHYFPTDRICAPIYDLAARYRVPVMFHSGDTYTKFGKLKYSHPLHLDEVAVDYPDTKIVICHLGNPWFRDTAEIIYKNDNVRADISGLILGDFEARWERWLADQVRDLILYAGDPEDLLFGTDWPLVETTPYLHWVKSIGLSEEHEEMLFHKNTEEWFDIARMEKRRGV